MLMMSRLSLQTYLRIHSGEKPKKLYDNLGGACQDFFRQCLSTFCSGGACQHGHVWQSRSVRCHHRFICILMPFYFLLKTYFDVFLFLIKKSYFDVFLWRWKCCSGYNDTSPTLLPALQPLFVSFQVRFFCFVCLFVLFCLFICFVLFVYLFCFDVCLIPGGIRFVQPISLSDLWSQNILTFSHRRYYILCEYLYRKMFPFNLCCLQIKMEGFFVWRWLHNGRWRLERKSIKKRRTSKDIFHILF